MKVKFYISNDGGIMASVDGEEMELCMLDTMAEFPEDACEQMTERFQKLLDEPVKPKLDYEIGEWPNDLTMLYERKQAYNRSLIDRSRGADV